MTTLNRQQRKAREAYYNRLYRTDCCGQRVRVSAEDETWCAVCKDVCGLILKGDSHGKRRD
jgi:hypothetical protein